MGNFDGRVLAGLLLLNLVAHFVPFERPGFQPDDYTWLRLARTGEPWGFVGVCLSQGVRPLGSLLFMLVPYSLGLHEGTQLAILVLTTSLLTLLTYAYLTRVLSGPMASLAAVVFVLWPVKHEIYASQLFGVTNVAAILVLVAGLLYSRWARTATRVALAGALGSYGLSLLIYEIGYLAPLLFWMAEGPRGRRSRGALLFLIPAALPLALRLARPEVLITIGRHEPTIATLGVGLPSLPSNLIGYQLARNIGYGLWAIWTGPLWLQLFWAIICAGVSLFTVRCIRAAMMEETIETSWRSLVGAGLVAAFLLAAPAATILVESRHSVLAALGMGVAIAAVAIRLRPAAGTVLVLVLLLSTLGLGLRQAEVSRLQASAYQVLAERQSEMRSASAVVIDIASLADRVPYTWGERHTNVLRGYWGLHAFSAGGFVSMIDDVLHTGTATKRPRVGVCASNLVVSETEARCGRHYATGRPFALPLTGSVVIDFKSMPLPPTIARQRAAP